MNNYGEDRPTIIGFLVRDKDGTERTVKMSPRKGKPIHAPEDALEWLYTREQEKMLDSREHFMVMYLDTRRRLIECRTISTGTLEASLVHPREVLAPAIELRASSILVAHNHPSGDAEPSCEDTALTQRLDKACSMLGIRLIDHIIIGRENSWVSMRQRQYTGETTVELFRA